MTLTKEDLEFILTNLRYPTNNLLMNDKLLDSHSEDKLENVDHFVDAHKSFCKHEMSCNSDWKVVKKCNKCGEFYK